MKRACSTGLELNSPVNWVVMVTTLRLLMPRSDMHWWTASSITADAARLKRMIDDAGDLRRHGLLGLQPPGIDLHDTRKLGNADHRVRGQIGDMGAADEWHDVMLAMGIELDVAQHDDVVIAFDLVEGARQRLIGILL